MIFLGLLKWKWGNQDLADFFDAIASPSSYPCQSVGESLIVSDLEIAIAISNRLLLLLREKIAFRTYVI